MVTVDGNVSVRAIAKTFASGKTEKLVYQTLAEVGLPSEKVITQKSPLSLYPDCKHIFAVC